MVGFLKPFLSWTSVALSSSSSSFSPSTDHNKNQDSKLTAGNNQAMGTAPTFAELDAKTFAAQVNEATKEIESVPTLMNFVTHDTVAPYLRRDVSGSDSDYQDVEFCSKRVDIQNGRLAKEALTLSRNGFTLVESTIPNDIDFYDPRDVTERYYQLCCKLLQRELGDDVQVYPFDHNVRSNGKRRTFEDSDVATVQSPIALTHADYTQVSAPMRLQQMAQPPKINDTYRRLLLERIGDDDPSSRTLIDSELVEQTLKGNRRYAIVNVWRSIDKEQPVLQRPLAMMDATSTRMDDLRTFKIHYEDRIGENYFCTHNDQSWYYFPKMTHQEAILLKTWDSKEDESCFAVHSAFPDPTSPEDAPPRSSIEVRCMILFPPKNNS